MNTAEKTQLDFRIVTRYSFLLFVASCGNLEIREIFGGRSLMVRRLQLNSRPFLAYGVR